MESYAEAYTDHPVWSEGFTSFDIPITSPHVPHPFFIHGVHATCTSGDPSAPAVVLLHGFPQNLNIWFRVAPLLRKKYHVVATDLRGYGKSGKPDRGENDVVYSKREMANDVVQVMEKLGYKKFFILSHDRGARVAHRLAVDHPGHVLAAIFLDIAPTLWMYEHTALPFAKAYWHWFALIQPHPLPERLFASSPTSAGELVNLIMLNGLPSIDPHCLKSYASAAAIPKAMECMIADYRASAPAGVDLKLDKGELDEGRGLEVRMKVIWGGKGIVGKLCNPVEGWRRVCRLPEYFIEGVEAPESGHYIPEDADPEWLFKQADDFFSSC